MSEFSVFKLKSPREYQSNRRISNRTPGLSPIEPVVVRVPSRTEVMWVFLAAIPVLAIALMTGLEGLRMHAPHITFPVSGMMFFCGIWYPIQAVKQRRDAIRINGWQPVYIEDSPQSRGEIADAKQHPVPIPVSSQLAVAVVWLYMIPMFVAGVLLAVGTVYSVIMATTYQGWSGVVFILPLPLAAAMIYSSIWYPIQKKKQRQDAIRINAWVPAIEKNQD